MVVGQMMIKIQHLENVRNTLLPITTTFTKSRAPALKIKLTIWLTEEGNLLLYCRTQTFL